MKIASLLPSATEIVCALGLRDSLVGVSHECDFPPEVVGLPVLTEPKIDPAGESAAIDAAVRRLVQDGLSVYRIKTEVLARLQPDLIVTQEQCDVCAVSYREVVDATQQLPHTPSTIVSLKPKGLSDILDDMQHVADAAGCVSAGVELTQRLGARLDAIRQRATVVRSRPRVACIEWVEPLMAAGHWIPELVELGGGTYGLARAGETSRVITWSDVVGYAPDVVIIMPRGFKLPHTQRELPRLVQRPEWQRLPAVRNRRVYAIDGNAYLNRPGPRIADSAELLAGLIQPGFFAAKVPAAGWMRVESV